ncbi:MAG: hypothetical protein ACTSUE_08755, partial [Promethearchaeota archaeon]
SSASSPFVIGLNAEGTSEWAITVIWDYTNGTTMYEDVPGPVTWSRLVNDYGDLDNIILIKTRVDFEGEGIIVTSLA